MGGLSLFQVMMESNGQLNEWGELSTTPVMVFSVIYTICEGPKVDAKRSRVSELLTANMISFVNMSNFFT